ncbi:hypothetical protein EG329_004552 [Mollisiaceae sp. DMI_Dod_QoI]|nr:hypothetical protein EG329_004552 [Helotiales sp. DMI_Dod_QoI]
MATVRRVVCTCNKSFKDQNAMLQHQRDSPKHVSRPIPEVPTTQVRPSSQSVDHLLNRLILQDAQYGPSLFSGRDSSAFLASSLDLEPTFAEIPATVATTEMASTQLGGEKKAGNGKDSSKKKAKRKKRTGNSSTGTSNTVYGMWKLNPNTGRMMDMGEDQNSGLCDKDCGWCGHCGDGIL